MAWIYGGSVGFVWIPRVVRPFLRTEDCAAFLRANPSVAPIFGLLQTARVRWWFLLLHDDFVNLGAVGLSTWKKMLHLVTGRCQYSDGIYFLVFKARLEIWMNRRKLWIFFLHDKKIVSTWMYNISEAVYRSDFRFVCDRLYDISKMDKRWRYLKDLALSHATNKGLEEKFGRIIESTQHRFLDHRWSARFCGTRRGAINFNLHQTVEG